MITSVSSRFFVILILCFIFLVIFFNVFPLLYSSIFPISKIVSTIIISYCLCRYILVHFPPTIPVDPCNKAIIVTGAASGFGRDLCIKLDKLGFTVFAGVRSIQNDQRVDTLVQSCSVKLRVIKLDVTKEEDIETVHQLIERIILRENLHLWALVNNAGIMKLHGALDGNSISTYQETFNVNTFGPIRVIKKFIPLLDKTPSSRIVLVSSMGSYISVPFMTNYCMSKYAMNAFGNGLRRELRSRNIHVAMIEPSGYVTPMTQVEDVMNNYETIKKSTEKKIYSLFSSDFHRNALEFIRTVHLFQNKDTRPVINAMVHSITTFHEPNHRYQVMGNIESFFVPFITLPSEMLDQFLNLSIFDKVSYLCSLIYDVE